MASVVRITRLNPDQPFVRRKPGAPFVAVAIPGFDDGEMPGSARQASFCDRLTAVQARWR
jgi:hypothetical protein